jgi:hypothetical protein
MPAAKYNLSILLLSLVVSFAQAQPETSRLTDLRGQWKFMIGDNHEWSDPNFDDRSWPSIFVPAAWEDEGYPGYNGYAWYRWTGTLLDRGPEESYFLDLGRVDDVDQTWVNGCLVGGMGTFPPQYKTAYYAWRWYGIPKNCLREDGRLLIAVRVYDSELSGGILEGNPAIQVQRLPAGTVMNLAGIWKFNRGDNLLWMQPAFNDESWTEHKVPLGWDQNGLRNYDGFGWYRVQFIAPRSWDGMKLTIELGRIDDVDEVYLNGVLIGSIGPVPGRNQPGIINNQWSVSRRYRIPAGVLRLGQNNVLAVRVFDDRLDGGIQGPYTVIRRTDSVSSAEWSESAAPPVEYQRQPTGSPWWERLIWW